MRVKIKYVNESEDVLHDITKIYCNHENVYDQRGKIIFGSDIHDTGFTVDIKNILKIEIGK